MWDFVLFLICAGDVEARGASDRKIKMRSSIVFKGGGYMMHSYSSSNHFFLNDLISAVDLRSYKGSDSN